jgi:outer membrane protein assembly complex protein YaeT
MRGALTGRLDLDIPLARPRDVQGEAQVDALRVERGDWTVETQRPFAARARAGRVQVDGLALAGSGLRLDLSGSFGLDADAPLELEAEGRVDLARLPPVPGLTLDGAVKGRVALSGRRARPRATGSITASVLAVESERIPRLSVKEARIDVEDETALMRPLTVQVAGGEATLAGRLPLAAVWREARREQGRVGPEEGAALSLTFESMDLAAFVERLRADRVSPVAGRLSGRLELEGGLIAPGEVRATLEVTPETVSVQDLPLEVSPLHLRIEEGEAVLADATIAAEGSRLTLGGRYDLVRESIDATAQGDMGLRALSPFLKDAALAGRAALDLRISGKIDAPQARGSLSIHDGTLRLRDLPQALTALEARLVLDDRSVRVEKGSAVLGGGTLTLAGGASLAGTSVSGVDLTLSGNDIALRYPEGLSSRLDADLALTGEPGALRLSGVVRVERGAYDLDLALERTLFGAVPTAQASPLLRSIGLDLRVEIENPVAVRSRLTRLDALGSLSVLGDLQDPAPVGRLELRPGGRVSLQGREFVIDSGRLVYNGTWEPEISLRAETVLRGVDLGDLYGRQDVRVEVAIEGPLDRPRASFTSEPAGYSEAEIVSMIATNRARREALGSGAWVAGEQAALFLTGRLTRGLSAELQELGIDEVTIQPELLARETDPGARFTFGKRLTDELRLIYSLSLNDPENRFVQLDFNPWRDVSLLAQRRDDGTFTLGGGQRLRFFGPPRRPAYREEKVRLEGVRIEGDGTVEEGALRAMAGVREGASVTDWDLQDEAERLRKTLREKGHLEAEVSADLDGKTAVLRVTAGPHFAWRVEGMADPPDLEPVIREALFEEEVLAGARRLLLEALYEKGHLEASIEARAVDEGRERTFVFRVEPGPVLRVGAMRFPGASSLSAERLLEVAGGPARLLAAPEDARRAIEKAYRESHYMAAEVAAPEVTRLGDEVSITVPIREGPQARVHAVRFLGASRPAEDVARAAAVEVGRPYDPALVPEAVARLRDLYFGLGHPNVRIAPRIEPAETDLDIVFEITEGPQLTVGCIEIVGLRSTREAFVRGRLGLSPGAPLDPRRLAAAERKLLALGVFSRASVTHSGESPVTVRVELEEEARLAAQYQLRYNDDRGPSGDIDSEVRNLLGRGLTLGARYSRGTDDEQIRSSIQLPSLGFFGDLTGSLFHNREEMPLAEEGGPTLRQLDKGLELQASRPLPNRWNLLYGYRFKTSRVSSELDDFKVTTKIASLDVSLLRDTRDHPLNARRGRFWSLNLEVAPRALASDLDFVKGMAQLFVSRSFGPSLTWAQGYRLGLAHAFGDRLVFTERFRAGGGNSVRGYATDSLGPRDFLEEPAGGEAVFVFNQELRYMLAFGVGGVVFYDAGNVFAQVSDLSLDLRQALGAGLRWDSPVGLLRLDVGFPLDRQAGEKTYRLHFSLGQAF